MCAGVVPQQPPTMFTQPSTMNRSSSRDSDCGRLAVLAVVVRQTRVRIAGRPRLRERRQAAEMVRHELGPRRAVESDREQRRVHDRGVERLDVLSREHRAHRLDRHRRHDRRSPSDLRERLLDADQPGLEVARVLGRLQEQDVGAAREKTDRLGTVVDDHLVERHAARHGHRLRRRSHGAGDEPQPPRRGRFRRRFAGELGRPPVDLDRPVREPVLREDQRCAAEGVRLDHVGAGREVVRVHPPHDVRPRPDQVFVAALELRAAEVGRRQVLALEPGPRRPVEHEDAFGEALLERLGPLALRRAVRPRGHGTGNYARRAPGPPCERDRRSALHVPTTSP